MALDTYSNLKTTIANYLNRDDLTAYLGDFITLTEARLNRELRVREMVEINTSTTTVAGTQSYDLPTGYLEAMTVIYQSDPFITLKFMANSDFYNKYNSSQSSGSPTYFTIVGTKILLGRQPDSAQTLQINHYKNITALSDSAVIADMALLADTDVIADMALLATSDIISDLNTLATLGIVYELNALATSDIIEDMSVVADNSVPIQTAQANADKAAGFSFLVQAVAYNINSNSDFGLVTDTGAGAVFANEDSSTKLSMSIGSSQFDYLSV